MYTKIFFSISLFFFFIFNASSQNIVVNFEEYGEHADNPGGTTYFQKLTINNVASSYKTIASDNQKINIEDKLSVYKDLKNNFVFNEHTVITLKMPIKDTLPQLFDWQLVDGCKEILGYECKRAIVQYRGRNFEAWYAPSIPVQNGPYKFHGLPGLILGMKILKEKSGDFKWNVEAIAIEFPKSPIELNNPYKNLKLYSWEEFKDKYTKIYEKLQHYIKKDESGTTTFSIPKGGIEMYVYD